MAEPIVVARDLSRHYDIGGGLFSKASVVRALNGVSFTLEPGRTLAVVGESGCGKSTLARLVTMIEEPTGGDLSIDGIAASDIGPDDRARVRATVQIVFQNPFGSLNPRQKIGDILTEPLVINRPDSSVEERAAKAREMLDLVGLRPEHYDRYPHMFSGGQRQRIAIARALMLEPAVIVLDEPVSALDLSIQSQILNLLRKLQDEFSLAYLFISHDLSVVRHVADEVLVMYLGRPVEIAPKEAIFAEPRHPYTAALLSATPIADPARTKTRIRLTGELPSPLNVPPGCPFHPRCWKADETCRTQVPELMAVAPGSNHRHACFHPLDPAEVHVG
jgi:dipeptide transport system ATP-binding protein